MTLDVQQMFKVKESKVKVTALHNVLPAKKIITFHERVGQLIISLVKIIPQHRLKHVKHVQGHKVKHSNRNNSATDCSISLKFGTEFHQITDDTLQMFKANGQGHNVT